ncbi:hypothetical protein C6Q14_27075 [Burkholderia ambifaria]|uniref:hypothetical protein n=1 Tax=Burkholderia ambifaria TaxID=152480 RepID=UPI000CFE6551|nr:hypothetical protein [Burkholderia ambifaria]MBR8186578.1 hypothetical protein [Burkholderia ambifaria]PRF98005.1 hypothetical protein C6Q14_27075 [Burkholderia ambifaria]
MAASEVATVVAQAPTVNWWVVGASSAVIGAAVNALTSLMTQHIAWKREQAKLTDQRAHEQAKLAQERAPAQLEVVLMLEAFAKQAVGYLDACEAHIIDWFAVLEGEAPREQRPWTALAFDVSLVEDWSAVPIGIVSQCRELPLALAESHAWVHAVAKEDWVDVDDAYRLDGQRAILYGLLACELANQIRAMMAVPASALATDTSDRLQGDFERLKKLYVQSSGKIDLIPDLKTRLQRELPQAMSEPGPALAKARR